MVLQVQICTLSRQPWKSILPLLPALFSHGCSFVIYGSIQKVCSALQSKKVPLFKVVFVRLLKAPKSLV